MDIEVLAEEVGFEPTDEDHSSLVFKTSALNRSATLPKAKSELYAKIVCLQVLVVALDFIENMINS